MNLEEHAMNEFKICGWVDEHGKWDDESQQHLCETVLKMIKIFSEAHFSGFSAGYATHMLEKLLTYKPLRPLTGKNEEWIEVADGLWQNKRCSHVFKTKDGKAYDNNGKIFKGKDGCYYTNEDSKVFINFPYSPHTNIVCE